MPTQLLFYAYVLAAVTAVMLLVLFRACRWYWHVVSLLAGLTAGLMPPPPTGGGDRFYLVTGINFMFFFMWGLGGLFVRRMDR